jgi:hypothetical protein
MGFGDSSAAGVTYLVTIYFDKWAIADRRMNEIIQLANCPMTNSS